MACVKNRFNDISAGCRSLFVRVLKIVFDGGKNTHILERRIPRKVRFIEREVMGRYCQGGEREGLPQLKDRVVRAIFPGVKRDQPSKKKKESMRRLLSGREGRLLLLPVR